MEQANAAEKVLVSEISHLQQSAQRAYHIGERLTSMLGRLNGPSISDKGDSDKPENPADSHLSIFRTNNARLVDELDHIEKTLGLLEELI